MQKLIKIDSVLLRDMAITFSMMTLKCLNAHDAAPKAGTLCSLLGTTRIYLTQSLLGTWDPPAVHLCWVCVMQ